MRSQKRMPAFKNWRGGPVSISITGKDLNRPREELEAEFTKALRDKYALSLRMWRKTIREMLWTK